MTPKDAHPLLSGICVYVTSHRRRVFADGINGMKFKIGRLFWIMGGRGSVITRVLKSGRGTSKTHRDGREEGAGGFEA